MADEKKEEIRYPVAYKIIGDANMTKEQLEAQNLGGCDQIIIHSIIGRAGNSEPRSEMILSYDPEAKGEVTDDELFSSWVMTAHALMESKTLGPKRKKLCGDVFRLVQSAILKARAAEEHNESPSVQVPKAGDSQGSQMEGPSSPG